MAKINEQALQWWDNLPKDKRIEVHKLSRWGHLPYETYSKYTVLITHTYKALHGEKRETH